MHVEWGLQAPAYSDLVRTGIVGCAIFSVISIAAAANLFIALRRIDGRIPFDRTSPRFCRLCLFIAILLLGILEVPRYASIARNGTYEDKPTYGLHLAGSVAYFSMFSIVCWMWSNVVKEQASKMFAFRSLCGVNLAFGSLVAVNVCYCLAASTLDEYAWLTAAAAAAAANSAVLWLFARPDTQCQVFPFDAVPRVHMHRLCEEPSLRCGHSSVRCWPRNRLQASRSLSYGYAAGCRARGSTLPGCMHANVQECNGALCRRIPGRALDSRSTNSHLSVGLLDGDMLFLFCCADCDAYSQVFRAQRLRRRE